MNIYFLPSPVERELLKTLWQHSLDQMAGILVDILFVIILFSYLFYLFIYYFIYLLFISINCGYGLYFDDRPITRKIRVAQKNVIEEKLLEIKRSIRRGSYVSFPLVVKYVHLTRLWIKINRLAGYKMIVSFGSSAGL